MNSRLALLAMMASLIIGLSSQLFAQEGAWQRFAVDDSLRGADGVRLADANRDGLMDIVTGWEESGQTCAYFHPGTDQVHLPWPKVVVGAAPAVEDAVWIDLNGDGQLDVLSSCEGQEQSLRVHLVNSGRPLLDPSSWSTRIINSSRHLTRWMFATPLSPEQPSAKENRHGPLPIVVGSKAPNGLVGLLQNGDDGTWKVHKLVDAQWIMSLQIVDMDHDGDPDILYSDRKGENSGVFWLENLSPDVHAGLQHIPGPWKKHLIGASGQEVMFIASTSTRSTDSKLHGNVGMQIFAAVKPNRIYRFSTGLDTRREWQSQILDVEPADQVGTAKAVAVADLDLDGQDELVFTCERAVDARSGVVLLKQDASTAAWRMHDVSGPEGIKFDRIELSDLDADGDLDILTCEERHAGQGLGVIWYANPAR